MKAYFIDGGLCKVFAKTLSKKLKKFLPQFFHPSQYGFIVGRNILHNVLHNGYRLCLIYTSRNDYGAIRLEKAYDHVNWSCLSTLPLKLNLWLFGIFQHTTLVPPGSTPCSRSSTCSTPRASTLLVGLSAHSALVSSPAVAVLALLLLPSLPLWPRLIQRV